MRLSRLIHLLSTFRPDERARLRLYVQSPYFVPEQTAAGLLPLLDLALRAAETPSDAWPDTAAAYAALFPNEPVVKGKVEKRIGALHQIALQFFALECRSGVADEPDRQMAMAHAFLRRSQFKLSRAALKTASDLLDRDGVKDNHHYRRRLQQTTLAADQAILENSKDIRTVFGACLEALRQYNQAFKLDVAAALNGLSQRIAFDGSPLVQSLLDEMRPEEVVVSEDPMRYISLRHLVLSQQNTPDFEGADHLEQVVRQYEHTLHPEEARRAWGMVRNTLLRWRLVCKDPELNQRYLAVALENLKNGHLYYNGAILPYNLETMCGIAADLGKPDLIKALLLEHRGKINGEPADEPFFHCLMARYFLSVGNPEEALRILPARMPEASFQWQVNLLELQILYDLQSDLFPYRLDAMRLYLRRSGHHRMGHTIRTGRQAFVNAIARLHRCPQGHRRRAAAIGAQIRATPITVEYCWLLKKVEEKMKP